MVCLQHLREVRASSEQAAIQFHDRSVICTAALADFLDYPASDLLVAELERVRSEGVFEPIVFFVRNLGFVERTDARRISYEDALRFEALHERTYLEYGYRLVFIEPGTVTDRIAAIMQTVQKIGERG